MCVVQLGLDYLASFSSLSRPAMWGSLLISFKYSLGHRTTYQMLLCVSRMAVMINVINILSFLIMFPVIGSRGRDELVNIFFENVSTSQMFVLVKVT